MNKELQRVLELLQQIVSDGCCSKPMARELESLVLETVPDADDDARFEELMHILASYEPGGGPYLFDESNLVAECRCIMKSLSKSDPPTASE